MKIYMKSSASTPHGFIGRGWHESKEVAERANVSERTIIDYFKSLVATDTATEVEAGKAGRPSGAKNKASKAVNKDLV